MQTATEHQFTWLDKLQPGACVLISDSAEADIAIVFVHGFLWDVDNTWADFFNILLSNDAKDPLWSRCDVFFFSYPLPQDITVGAQQFLEFLKAIFPHPPGWMFQLPATPGALAPFPRSLIELNTIEHRYSRLVLVGHSSGGVVIRRAVELAYPKLTRVLLSRLALFAPFLGRPRFTKWIGLCLSISKVATLVMPILRAKPVFVELEQGDVLNEIKEHTGAYRTESESQGLRLTGLRAHLLFGSKDKFARPAYYVGDCLHSIEQDKDHLALCKPKAGYDRPITFVLDRVNGVERCTDSSNS